MTGIRTFHPLAGVQSAQGLDVSNFQGQFRGWNTPGLSFGINRLTQGLGAPGTNSPDPQAGWNHKAIRDAGLHRGCYHFLDPFLSGAAQARYFVTVHDQEGFTQADMLFLDNETAGTSPAATAACAQAFMTELRALRPHNPMGVYSNLSFDWNGYDAGLGHWPAWLAWPAASAPVPAPTWSRWFFWQWGMRNGVDADAFNGTSADLDAWIASFAAQPVTGPPYVHLTDGITRLADIAASRNMTVSSFLAEQARQYQTQTAALAALAAVVPPKGIAWFTNSP